MKLALLTASKHPQGVLEDQPLWNELKTMGIAHDVLVWDHKQDWSQYDAALIRSTWDYHERQSEFLSFCEQLNQIIPVLNPPEVLHWNASKSYLRELETARFPVAPTIWLNQGETPQLAEVCHQMPSEQWFLKPVIGADSSGTLRFGLAEMDTATRHLEHHLCQQDMMLQPYLKSVEKQGELSVIYFGSEYSHAVIKKPVAGDFRVQDTHGGTDFPHQANDAVLQLSDQLMRFLIRKFDSLCYARLDYLFNEKQQPMINEVELIEPSLFLHHSLPAAGQLIKSIVRNMS